MNEMQHLSEAVRLLRDARDLDEVERIRNMALAAETYARAERLGRDAVAYAREVRLRASRKGGQLLTQMIEDGLREAQGGDRRSNGRPRRLKLVEDLGVDHNRASRWTRIAAIPDEEFERRIAEGATERTLVYGTKTGTKLTPKAKTKGLTERQSLRGLQSLAVQVEALALALQDGHLADFERIASHEEAQPAFESLEQHTPLLVSGIKRAIRAWRKEQHDANRSVG
jgi:hypothetical protein